MTDYSDVNNPFITFRNPNSENEFTVDLSKNAPQVDNDPSMSNLKKSNHSLYSDNRAYKMKMGDDVKSFGQYAITLLDIDNIIYEYFTKVINPTVVDSNNELVSVPVRHASPERWSAIQSDGVYRDNKGQLQRPIIVFTRTGVQKDDSFVTFNKYLSVPFVKKYSNKNSYDRFSLLNDAQPLQEVHNVTFPDHVVLNYDFTMSTEYVQQMNQLIETINFAEGDYWGEPTKLKFRASIDSFSNNTEVPSDDDRVVSSTFTLTINAYLLPKVFDNKTTVQRNLTTRKVEWGLETTSSALTNTTKKEEELDFKIKKLTTLKNMLLNRKQSKIFLNNEYKNYSIRIWNDLEEYTINVNGRNFNIKCSTDSKSIVWDAGPNQIEMVANQTEIVELNSTESIEIKLESGCEMLSVSIL
jgi:hypothetical protein